MWRCGGVPLHPSHQQSDRNSSEVRCNLFPFPSYCQLANTNHHHPPLTSIHNTAGRKKVSKEEKALMIIEGEVDDDHHHHDYDHDHY